MAREYKVQKELALLFRLINKGDIRAVRELVKDGEPYRRNHEYLLECEIADADEEVEETEQVGPRTPERRRALPAHMPFTLPNTPSPQPPLHSRHLWEERLLCLAVAAVALSLATLPLPRSPCRLLRSLGGPRPPD